MPRVGQGLSIQAVQHQAEGVSRQAAGCGHERKGVNTQGPGGAQLAKHANDSGCTDQNLSVIFAVLECGGGVETDILARDCGVDNACSQGVVAGQLPVFSQVPLPRIGTTVECSGHKPVAVCGLDMGQ